MTFMNKKEQVIDLQLTQYGKHLLSKGTMRPVYYAFFDNNIIYDSQYAGITEEPREVQGRIQITPQSETQYAFTSLERQVKELNELIRDNKVKINEEDFQNYQVKEYALPLPLGSSALSSSKAPSWNMNFLKGEFVSANSSIVDALPVIKIPQINVEPITYETQVKRYEEGQDIGELSELFDDGFYLSIEEDYVLFSLDEKNTEVVNDNFTIEVFITEEVDEQGNVVKKEDIGTVPTKEQLTPLSFVRKKKNIENNILIEDSVNRTIPEVDPSYVEYWFEVRTDSEIDREDICENLPSPDQDPNIYNAFRYDCPDASPVPRRQRKAVQDTEDDC